jgi:hypothetical protein
MVYLERTFHENKEVWKNTVEPCGQAVFWPSTEGAPESSSFRRHLMGEIHLKANLQPSSSMLGFAVEVCLLSSGLPRSRLITSQVFRRRIPLPSCRVQASE